MFPEVSVSALTRHVKHCEGKATGRKEITDNIYDFAKKPTQLERLTKHSSDFY